MGIKTRPAFLTGIVCMMLVLVAPQTMAAAKLRILVLDTELNDFMKRSPTEPDKPEHLVRIGNMAEQIRDGLNSSDYYEVIATDSVRGIIKQHRSGRYLHQCPGCITGIGEAAGVDLVFVSWVNIVSSLAQHQNLVAYDVKTGEPIMAALPTYFRGNKGPAYDKAWRYATNHLLEDFFIQNHDGHAPVGLRNRDTK